MHLFCQHTPFHKFQSASLRDALVLVFRHFGLTFLVLNQLFRVEQNSDLLIRLYNK